MFNKAPLIVMVNCTCHSRMGTIAILLSVRIDRRECETNFPLECPPPSLCSPPATCELRGKTTERDPSISFVSSTGHLSMTHIHVGCVYREQSADVVNTFTSDTRCSFRVSEPLSTGGYASDLILHLLISQVIFFFPCRSQEKKYGRARPRTHIENPI